LLVNVQFVMLYDVLVVAGVTSLMYWHEWYCWMLTSTS